MLIKENFKLTILNNGDREYVKKDEKYTLKNDLVKNN